MATKTIVFDAGECRALITSKPLWRDASVSARVHEKGQSFPEM
jgi:hypothetical protein